MSLDLDRVLEQTQKGQWSLDDFDWARPLEGVARLSADERRAAGLMLVFTAGLERRAAQIFELAGKFVTDPRAQAIYRLFTADEQRHADAELRLARRYGVGWKDLPLPTRMMFKRLQRSFDDPSPFLYEMTSTQIVLFEIGLDALLLPTIKERVQDPLQKDVFRRIDVDESRHLAMDYWLLDRKGGGTDRGKVENVEREIRRFLPTLLWMPLGFSMLALRAKAVQRQMLSPERLQGYWQRVNGVPRRAPQAMRLRSYRDGVRLQRRLQRLGMIVSGRRKETLPAWDGAAA